MTWASCRYNRGAVLTIFEDTILLEMGGFTGFLSTTFTQVASYVVSHMGSDLTLFASLRKAKLAGSIENPVSVQEAITCRSHLCSKNFYRTVEDFWIREYYLLEAQFN